MVSVNIRSPLCKPLSRSGKLREDMAKKLPAVTLLSRIEPLAKGMRDVVIYMQLGHWATAKAFEIRGNKQRLEK